MTKTVSSWIWLGGLASVLALPVLLLGALDATLAHHLAWALMKSPMHPGPMTVPLWLVVLGLLVSALLGGYLYRLIAISTRHIREQSTIAAKLESRLSPLPEELIPPNLAPSNQVRFVSLTESTPHAFTYGFRTPTIVIAHSMQHLLDRQALAAIIAHEYSHVRSQDYAIQQLFIILIHTLPGFGFGTLYRQYLTIREIQADQFATSWQHTPDHLIHAMVATVRALKNQPAAPFPSEPAWNSGWQARIDALASSDGGNSHHPVGILWPFLTFPAISSSLFVAACIAVACH
ncbi:MAG: M48 family metalloprotease [Sulfobacillus thermotolerans]|nr:M48 family metalloprotease [Sulfobacillus thermotolerans]